MRFVGEKELGVRVMYGGWIFGKLNKSNQIPEHICKYGKKVRKANQIDPHICDICVVRSLAQNIQAIQPVALIACPPQELSTIYIRKMRLCFPD